jgi:hypothetical protein
MSLATDQQLYYPGKRDTLILLNSFGLVRLYVDRLSLILHREPGFLNSSR